MGVLTNFLKPTVAAALFAMAGFLPQVAGAAGLADLFAQLQDADPTRAGQITKEIQLEWDKSGSATADFLLKRGRDALERGEIDAAIEHLTALVDHAPEFAEGWETRAQAYFHSGLLGPAVQDLEQALALDPMHFEAMIGLGAVFEMIERPQDAYEAYQQVKTIHPTHPDVTEALERLAPLVEGQAL